MRSCWVGVVGVGGLYLMEPGEEGLTEPDAPEEGFDTEEEGSDTEAGACGVSFPFPSELTVADGHR